MTVLMVVAYRVNLTRKLRRDLRQLGRGAKTPPRRAARPYMELPGDFF
jgi:hypothetical protein